ncbi:hypothetical protein [Pseudomonas matsuisoli]|jgi:hypothetical protein|uniref:Uncharacterized protein n=1 Tax=Pseudomonas matsuisoli TaxID=1515666 RepID=A0A917PKP1_9PSED|nr:hypothetical protein [Pseudomonas matsuisoli]GGJ82647.1 hypothetical protein GCM10009304_05800 [Pseudomonas matsuisoli]
MSEHPHTANASGGNKGGCLWLMLAGVAFIVLVFAIIIYSITRPSTDSVKANERAAIEACWKRANDETATPTSRSFAKDSCVEREKQYRIKFGDEPK